MSGRRKQAWPIFLAASATGFAALALLTFNARASASEHNLAIAEAQHQEDLRTALYRMEQRIAPLFARVFGRLEVPELACKSASLRLDLDAERAIPLEHAADTPEELVAQSAAGLSADLDLVGQDLSSRWVEDNGNLGSNYSQVEARGATRSDYEYQQRRNVQTLQNSNRGWVVPGDVESESAETSVEIGPLSAGWEGEPVEQLVLVRGIVLDDQHITQSLWIGWPELQALLLEEVDDLFSGATLSPVQVNSQGLDEGNLLVTIPARLVVPSPLEIESDGSALLFTTAATWSLALLAFIAASMAFRTSQRDAARQRRFTSAVTHELRTPLTTFRMYSEMLARDMVPPERRGEYLRSLEEESRRLGSLVENVLAHARLEEGTAQSRREDIGIQDLVQRVQAPLMRRCEEAGTKLFVDLSQAGEARISTDPEAVALILSNLVDNACKYGAPDGGHSTDTPIRLHAAAIPEGVVFAVSDEGPGIPTGAGELIFKPFERAGRDESDASPGVGLGLALARDLARGLDSELHLGKSTGTGTTFELRLGPRIS